MHENLRGVDKIDQSVTKTERAIPGKGWPGQKLILLFTSFLTAAFARQCFFHALLLARLQVKGVSLDLLDDVFLLHFALKPAQGILEGFSLLQSDFCQLNYTPNLVQMGRLVIARFCS
jgi:hypothetical protein